MRHHVYRPNLVLLALAYAQVSGAVPVTGLNDCRSIQIDAERLACYDQVSGSSSAPSGQRNDNEVFPNEPNGRKITDKAGKLPASLLDSRWELDEKSKQGSFHIRAYKPVYILPLFYTSSVNRAPGSPAADHTVLTPEPLRNGEMKYQLSLKAKVRQGVIGDHGDLWLGYTQVSHWQIDNTELSRPFRETNYEPEAMLVFATNYSIGEWTGKMISLGVNHQSNGRGLPQSRSWNRLMFGVGLEHGDWTLNLRPWWRLSESADKDDNPDISDYMGRGDVQLVRAWNGHEFSLRLRHTLRGGDRSRGATEFDWAFPIKEELRGHVQLFDGYGESLIDYNHRATYLGLGLSLLEWY